MDSHNIAALLNVLGWVIGLALYAMLFAMSLGSFQFAGWRAGGNLFHLNRKARGGSIKGFDVLPIATALLGLVWNAGTLATYGLQGFGANTIEVDGAASLVLLGAWSYAALGFLPAVVVHSAVANLSGETNERLARLLMMTAYVVSSIAAMMHFASALTIREPSSTPALYLLTGGFVLLMFGLFLLTRGESGGRRAVSATALAVFAVSALHLSSGGTTHTGDDQRWYTELIGHHASLPLALAILYQDYRFAFADIFLKRALSLLALVALITVAFSFYLSTFASPSVTGEAGGALRLDARALGVLLALWAGTALAYEWIKRATNVFVEKIVLRRVDYVALRAEVARVAQQHESSDRLLDDVCARLQPALTAHSLTWSEIDLTVGEGMAGEGNVSSIQKDAGEIRESVERAAQIVNIQPRVRGRAQNTIVVVPTTEAPHYEINIGELAGGRRLLSDDIEMLESVAITLARRIDALRVTHERCEQVQREQEIAKLATEAQLRALRAQINPHFLFNALTTVGYLIQTSPPRALETLLRLTDLLRRVLRATSEWVTLGEELKLIEAYLDIERARFEERLRVRFDVGRELYDLLVPSLVVQPLIENAIKHGITPLKAGGEIHITARLEKEILIIGVRDTGAGVGSVKLIEGRRKGVGLANVEQRLRLCCGDAGKLDFESAPDSGAMAELRVPVRHQRAETRTQAETNESNVMSPVTAHRINVDAAARR